MNKRYYEHTLPIIRGSLSNTYVERYVLGYMGFWNIAFIRKETLNECHDGRIIQKAKESIERYVASHPPAATLPRFYIVFLNQPQIGCDADSLSDVFCM